MAVCLLQQAQPSLLPAVSRACLSKDHPLPSRNWSHAGCHGAHVAAGTLPANSRGPASAGLQCLKCTGAAAPAPGPAPLGAAWYGRGDARTARAGRRRKGEMLAQSCTGGPTLGSALHSRDVPEPKQLPPVLPTHGDGGSLRQLPGVTPRGSARTRWSRSSAAARKGGWPGPG